MGLLSGLEGFGLGKFKAENLYVEEKKEEVKKQDESAPKEKVIQEKDYLFMKSYTCPVCDRTFKVPTVRAGKSRLLSQDDDLRPHYEGVDPLKYDAILCNHCGFAAISRGFTNMSKMQMHNIKEQVCASFKPLPEPGETYTYDDAIIRHKIALVCSMVKNAKTSEKAYTCLKLAWLTKSRLEQTPESSPNRQSLTDEYMECLNNAYDGFVQAFAKEPFPMCGMDEMTLSYLVAEIGRQLGHHEDAARMVSRILGNKSVSPRLKDKTLELKERIKADVAAGTAK